MLIHSARTAIHLSLLLGWAAACTEVKSKGQPGPATPPATNAEARDYAAYTKVVWADEFDGNTLDPSKWTYEVKDTWYNNELQATTNRVDNLTVTGGNLNIIARREAYNGKQYTSARIVTSGKHDFEYGRYDVRAQMPTGKGLWPAAWMLGSCSAPWPACGEIDIAELRGSAPARNLTTMHFGVDAAHHLQAGTTYTLPNASATNSLATDFHIYTVVRSQDKMRFYLDGIEYYSFDPNNASPYPFNNPFYAILNVAVGGDFDGNPDATTVFPQTMQVDYVRFSQYPQ
jgi:beta-glucanase (GH16 family)